MRTRILTPAILTLLAALAPAALAQPHTRVANGNVHLRAGPSAATTSLAVILEGTAVAVDSCANRWCAVTHAGIDGFASARYLSIPADADPTAGLSPAHAALVAEHVFGGLPACPPADLLVRRGYVNCYDPGRRVPRWVAFRVTRDYLDGPPRNGRFDAFRTDPTLADPVRNADYSNSGYDRGHLAPFAVMGGDRDGDGLRAELALPSDPDDEQTIFEANYMSNMAPQRGLAFNGGAGVWRRVEAFIQEALVGDPVRGRDTWVFAGPVFGPGRFGAIGRAGDIEVPPMFFQIAVRRPAGAGASAPPAVLAFLLPHHQTAHGDIEDFLVSVDVVEALTGLDFFSDLPAGVEVGLEARDTWDAWEDP